MFHIVAVDPTAGYTSLPLDESNFDIQRPYNYINVVHKMWMCRTDKPHSSHSPDSHTNPHPGETLKLIIKYTPGYDFSIGVWQFSGHGYVPKGTSGECIIQIFGVSPHATTLMLRTYKGPLSPHFFKCGVSPQDDDSHYLDSHWKNIKIFKKN
ncbi:hypothetical protein DCAR_0519114 [Daucus carota subsp. sativus]|uniref:Uncharacterized protein n=1 Tax=Daucus carota subsp. sativus TaxID=79200 RepID=A0AAF0X1N6_DAUCS|nr:hypothetical protein DCAR_0519114 [Daucus carota subsp. sativus]